MKHILLLTLAALLLLGLMPASVAAQDPAFPLPAPLYLLTSDHTLLRIDPVTGEQRVLSSVTQPVADFAIAPDGQWYAYRNLEHLVIVGDLSSDNGYVLEFDVPAPPSSDAQTISWSPDASTLAYVVDPGKVRIAELGAGEYGSALFSDIPGAWREIYWVDSATLIARDASGNATRISRINQQWSAEAAPSLLAAPVPDVPSTLTPNGVTLNNDTVIPATAGAVAFAWGPLPPSVVETVDLPADLFFLMADDHGVSQVWQLRSGALPYQWTAEPEGIMAYAISPVNDQIAYTTPTRLVVAGSEGGQMVAALQTQDRGASLAWSSEGSQIAYHDAVGLWIVPANGSQPARLVREHLQPDPNASDIVNIQIYTNPRWSPDGSLLLVTIGLWEGSQQGLISTATGELTPMNTIYTSHATWTRSGQIIAWSGFWGYEIPGLFLADPAAPDAPAVELIDPGTPVLDVFQTSNGNLFIVRSNGAQQGPSFVSVQSAPAPTFSPFSASSPGGYATMPTLFAKESGTGNANVVVAGLRHLTYSDQGRGSGDLVILDLSGGAVTLVQIQTPKPVSGLQWGR